MLSENQLKILASFYPFVREIATKEIERATGLSHERVFSTLKSLVKGKYIKERKIGKTNVYEFVFNDESYFVYLHFIIQKTNSFKEKHPLLYKRLKEFAEAIKARCVVLFGSYAKGTMTKQSDVDILVVSDTNSADKIASVFKTKYNLNIKPVTVHVRDFKNIKSDNAAFYNDLIEFGIILDGFEFFFKEVYEDGKVFEMVSR